jgi:AmiR/NasT family two-component response regulator
MSEQVAYETLREQAMNKRTTIEAIAMAVINASDLLPGQRAVAHQANE